jgi:D-alanyl-D-alanine carboxypeptidase
MPFVPRLTVHIPRQLMALPLVLLLLGLVAWPVAAAPGNTGTVPVASYVEPPEVSAQGVYAYDLATGIVLYEKNADERMQIGSTVKVATALVVVANAETSEEVLIQEDDTVDITVFSNMQLQAGDTLTVGTLLYGLLIPSGNDGALALARHVGSSMCGCDDRDEAIATFVQAMNDYAASLGLENTRFAHPAGIDSENAYSTAHDIAILFGELMKDEYLAGIVAEPAYSFYSAGPEARNYQEDTTNQLLGQMGVVGGKTGTTEAAGGCVVLARQVNGGSNTVITAVLGSDVQYDENSIIVDGSDRRWDDARSIFGAMDEQYAWVVPGSEGTFPGLAEEMAVWQVQFASAPTIPYPRSGVETAYQLVLGGAGGESGAVRLYYDRAQVGSVPVSSIAAVADPRHQVVR